MENERSKGFKYKSNSKSRIITRCPMMMVMVMMNMMMMVMKIDGLASSDPSSVDDGPLLASFPSGSLLKVRFFGFLVALCLAFQIQLHELIIFDKAVLMPSGMGRPNHTTGH
jgi:hypothetical protein